MQKLSILALAIVIGVGCAKKKDDKPSLAEKTTEMGMEGKPANPETATKPGNDMKTDTPAAPPVGAVEEMKTVSADAPKECRDAYVAYKKLHDCDKVDPETKKTLMKSWNLAVTGSIEQLGAANADQKKTIIDSCSKMTETAALLTKDCP